MLQLLAVAMLVAILWQSLMWSIKDLGMYENYVHILIWSCMTLWARVNAFIIALHTLNNLVGTCVWCNSVYDVIVYMVYIRYKQTREICGDVVAATKASNPYLKFQCTKDALWIRWQVWVYGISMPGAHETNAVIRIVSSLRPRWRPYLPLWYYYWHHAIIMCITTSLPDSVLMACCLHSSANTIM